MLMALLIVHGLLAVALLGAITHQALAASVPRTEPRTRSFFARFRGTDATAYAGAVVGLFLVVAAMGAVLYPRYRLAVRPLLQTMDLRAANGAFELKEHFAALGLLLLPAYWVSWRQPLAPEYDAARIGLTWILTFMVWWNFVVGQLLVAVKGLFP